MNNVMNLCFDFDGPIIDITDRYYQGYLESLKGTDHKKLQILNKEHFWELKQNRISDLEIGLMSGLNISEAKDSAEIRRDLYFKSEYFALDKLFDDVFKTFDHLKANGIFFYIVTLRRKKQLYYAMNQFKINKYLSNEYLFPIPDDKKISFDIQEKYLLFVEAINRATIDPKDTWLITDSETDIHAGRLAKYGKIIAIARGIRSKKQLEILNPDLVISSLTELIPDIK